MKEIITPQRSKATFIILCFFVQFLYSQVKESQLKEIIVADLNEINRIYDCNISYSKNVPAASVKVISLDSISAFAKIYDIYKVKVKIDNVFTTSFNDDERTFDYYLVKKDSKIFKLFGFFSSEILLVWSDLAYKGSGWSKKTIIQDLMTQRFWSKSQIHSIINSCKKMDYSFSTKIKMPCNILHLYFKDASIHLSSSYIVRPEPYFSRLK